MAEDITIFMNVATITYLTSIYNVSMNRIINKSIQAHVHNKLKKYISITLIKYKIINITHFYNINK